MVSERPAGFNMKKMIALTLMFVVIYACAQSGDAEKKIVITHVVIEYNKVLSEGYRNMNMSRLLDVATEERAAKAYYHMSALGEGRIKMDAHQTKISFPSITIIAPDRAVVKTYESWDYTHINIDTNEIITKKSADYSLTYSLIRKDDRWLVSNISIDQENEVSH